MSMFRALDISASGLYAGRLRMDAIAHNIANVQSTRDGVGPHRRREVVLAAAPAGGGVRVVGIREDPSPPQAVYRPGDPAADERGYVHLSNVNLPLEMVDLVAAGRAYEANAAAFKTGREMAKRALDIMR